jgi:Tfp pilus assembly PilM family ATPase
MKHTHRTTHISRFSSGINAGIVLGYTGLVYVIARVDGTKNAEIIAWGKEAYGEGITRKSPEFNDVVKQVLHKCLGKYRNAKIWCTIQSKGVETRFLVVPDAPSKHLAKAVLWAFKKEVSLGDDHIVFDFDVIGTRETKGRQELEILACSAPVSELDEIKSVFQYAGRPLTGITVTSFAFQNLFRTGFSGEGSQNIATLFIGTDWSRIDIFSNGYLILSRDIKTGTRSMDEVFVDQVEPEKQRLETVIDMDRYLSESAPEVSDNEKPVDDPENIVVPEVPKGMLELLEKGTAKDRELFFSRIIPVVNRLIRQMERTFEHFTMTSVGRKVERLYFTGPLCSFRRLLEFTGEQLNIPVHTIDPFPGEDHDDMTTFDEFVPATGLALSDNQHTLNFNFTYKDKENKRINRTVTCVLALMILVTAGAGFLFQKMTNSREMRHTATITQMTLDIAMRENTCGRATIMAYSDRLIEKKKQLEGLKKKAFGAAVLADISRVTQGHIRLTSFLFEQDAEFPGSAHVELKGVALGQPEQAKAEHDAWIETIKGLNRVKQVTVTHSGQAAVDDQQVLYFEMDLTLDDKPKA